MNLLLSLKGKVIQCCVFDWEFKIRWSQYFVLLNSRFVTRRGSAVEPCNYCSAPVPFESPEIGFCQGENCTSSNVKRHKLLRCAVCMEVCPSVPLWFCVCCHRSAFRFAPEPLFRMSSCFLDLDSSNKSSSQTVSSKPLCPFCGILLQRKQPDFLLSPTPV